MAKDLPWMKRQATMMTRLLKIRLSLLLIIASSMMINSSTLAQVEVKFVESGARGWIRGDFVLVPLTYC